MMPPGLIVVRLKRTILHSGRSEPGLDDPKPGGFGYVCSGGEVIIDQMRLAAAEATDAAFVPAEVSAIL